MLLRLRRIVGGNIATRYALVEPLASLRDPQAVLIGGCREGLGQGEVSGEALDFLRKGGDHIDD